MEHLLDSWSLWVILLSAFVIGWAAETAQTFISRALALSILAWLQTLPEFAVEASIAWAQNRELMIANLTGSLRLILGLGWPMIFFTQFFFQGIQKRRLVKEIVLEKSDSISVVFLFIAVLYFVFVLFKGSLTCVDSVWLTLIYGIYLWILMRMPAEMEAEAPEDLPWIGRQIMRLEPVPKVLATVFLFAAGGIALYLSVHPFIDTLQKWSLSLGISTFVFIQWVAPFLSEFPEKVSAFNWARQPNKAPMAMMNMVGSNINQWTMLAAMIPIVFNISLGRFEPVTFDSVHWHELALTIAQSFLGGILLLDLRFSLFDASLIFVLWLAQFVYSGIREEITWVYVAWSVYEVSLACYHYWARRELPEAIRVLVENRRKKRK